jgi:HPt (histidine-containing phosphotransfer) domain-containing protein
MDVEVPVDLGRLEEIAGDDEAFIEEILETFVTSVTELMEPLRAGVLAGDTDAICRESHRLKGSSATIGAGALQARSGALEILGQSGSIDGAREILREIEAELARVQTFVDLRRRT